MENKKLYENCILCPRNCNANRSDGNIGTCMVSGKLKLARAALHYWEEPCISGEEGSGAVFFSGCSLHCVFCQNEEISRGQSGKEVEKERLAEIFLELQEKGANNINLVTPGQYVPHIIWAVEQARNQGLKLPIVYNTSSYEKVETIRRLQGIVDIYLPDFKYMSSDIAMKYSKAKDYPEVAKAAIAEMVRQQPNPVFDEETGLMKRGVIVRQLLLPNLLEDAKAIVKYLYDTYGDNIYLSLMSQFTPLSNVENYPELNRKVSEMEYEEYVNYAIDLGVENGFIQEGDVAQESFIPHFDCEGV